MFGLGKPVLLEKIESKYSGTLQVMKGYGYKYVHTGQWTQTGGVIEDVWNPILKKLKNPKGKKWLILGLAAGTAARLIAKKYNPSKIVGVEIDPEMINIGKKYFDLDKIKNLEVVNIDANKYKFEDRFDFILVDMYLTDKLPDFVYDSKFLSKLKENGTVVVFNHLFYEDWMKEKAELLVDKCRGLWPSISLHRVLTNIMVICG